MQENDQDASTCDARRALYHMPIIHTRADMGHLAAGVKRATIEKAGSEAWRRNARRVDRLWTEIEEAVARLRLDYGRVRVYQDGLPLCGKEGAIIAELAAAGSRNHRLLKQLQEAGATIMGTESPELLLEEYRLTQQILNAAGPRARARAEERHRELSRSLLRRRDEFIAERINCTLLRGETGILFLGMLHSLGDLLAADIVVYYPLHHPRLSGGGRGLPRARARSSLSITTTDDGL